MSLPRGHGKQFITQCRNIRCAFIDESILRNLNVRRTPFFQVQVWQIDGLCSTRRVAGQLQFYAERNGWCGRTGSRFHGVLFHFQKKAECKRPRIDVPGFSNPNVSIFRNEFLLDISKDRPTTLYRKRPARNCSGRVNSNFRRYLWFPRLRVPRKITPVPLLNAIAKQVADGRWGMGTHCP